MAETFAIWKPKGVSSFAALGAIRRANKGERVGHAGTLDPLAEGILVVAVGRDETRKLHEAVGADKEYIATVHFGATSVTDDSEGPITENPGAAEFSRESLDAEIAKQVGDIKQVPPVYSAVHVGGERSYDLARSGRAVYLGERDVTIFSAELLDYEWPNATIRYVTGPGVYIRSLARDLGTALGTGSYMSGLVRTRVGVFTRDVARKID